MSTIRKRGDYQFQAVVRRKGYPDQSKTFTSRRDAETWALQVESEMTRGVFVSRVEAERTMLGELIERYIKEVTPGKKSSHSEKLRLAAMLRTDLAERYVATLKASDFVRYRDARLKVRQPATVVKELGLLSRVFTIAVREWDLGISNPLATVTRPRVKNERLRALSTHEEARLLQELELQGRDGHGRLEAGGVRNAWVRPMVQLALETAMRRGELLALEWKNVDLQRSVAVLPDTKNGDRREVPLSPAAVRLLQELPRVKREDGTDEGRVFPTTADAVKKAFERAVQRAGLDDFVFHDLRRAGATRLAKILPVMDLARVTGHRQLNILYLRYYTTGAEEIAAKIAAARSLAKEGSGGAAVGA